MNVTAILFAALIVGGVGILIGFFLGISGEKFKVEVDEKEEAILGVLPGNNCGGCGYAGCSGLAAAIAKGEAPVNQCPVGGAPVAAKIGEIMGVAAEEGERKVAFVKCAGTCEKAGRDYEYTGNEDCAAMAFVPNGGPKSCNYGCLGYGSCVKACPFDAIHIVDGIAQVDKEVCKACGKCVAACPKHLIELVPYKAKHIVQCSSKDKGKDVNALKATLISFLLLLGFFYAGDILLRLFHVDIESFAVAGAFVIFLLSLEMILDIEIFKNQGPIKEATLVPLVFPLLAGAGSFTTLLSLRAEYASVNIIVALILNMLWVYFVVRMTRKVERVLGKGGIYLIRKFFGIILLAISVKLFMSNITLLMEQIEASTKAI